MSLNSEENMQDNMLAPQQHNYSCVKLFQQLSCAHEIKQVWNNISFSFQCVIEKCALNFLCWQNIIQNPSSDSLGLVRREEKREAGPQTSISLIIIHQFHTHLCLISIGNLHYPIRTEQVPQGRSSVT